MHSVRNCNVLFLLHQFLDFMSPQRRIGRKHVCEQEFQPLSRRSPTWCWPEESFDWSTRSFRVAASASTGSRTNYRWHRQAAKRL